MVIPLLFYWNPTIPTLLSNKSIKENCDKYESGALKLKQKPNSFALELLTFKLSDFKSVQW